MKVTLSLIVGLVIGSISTWFVTKSNPTVDEIIKDKWMYVHEQKQVAYYISSMLRLKAFNLDKISDERFSPYSRLAWCLQQSLSAEEDVKSYALRDPQYEEDYEVAHQDSITIAFLLEGLVTVENFPGGDWARESWEDLVNKQKELFKEGYGKSEVEGHIALP